jgi:hypothetical protein
MPSRHGWPCVVKPWWSFGAATWIRQVVCTFNIRWWYKSILVVGEFRKTRHPRNVEFNEVLKACFSGAGNSRFSEIWDLRSLEFANVQSLGILIRQEEESRACGSPESQLLIVRTSEELPIREPDEDSVRDSGAWTCTNRLGNKGHFGNLSKTKFGKARTFTNHGRSKVKVVVPKSPGLECELVADL